MKRIRSMSRNPLESLTPTALSMIRRSPVFWEEFCEGCYAALPAVQFDVDFLRLFRHNCCDRNIFRLKHCRAIQRALAMRDAKSIWQLTRK